MNTNTHPQVIVHRPSRRRFWGTTGIIGALAVGALGIASLTQPAEAVVTPNGTTVNGTGRTIIVNGTGRVSETPDRMILNLGIETRAPRVATALTANNEAATAMNKLLKEKGIDAKDIQTSGLSIYPQFDNTGRKITGYQVNNNVMVIIRNLATAGATIDAVAASGGDAIRINGLTFAIGDSTKSQGRARELAVADARTQAEQLTKAAGVKLGALRTISTSSDQGIVPQPMAKVSQDAAAGVPIEAGSLEVSASVRLVYDIS